MVRRKSIVCRKRHHPVDMIRFRLVYLRIQCFTLMGTLVGVPDRATYTWVKPVVPCRQHVSRCRRVGVIGLAA